MKCIVCEERIPKGDPYILTDHGIVCSDSCWKQLAKEVIGYSDEVNEE